MLSPQVPLNWKLLIESFNLILDEVNPVYDPALPALPLDKDVLCSLACGPVLGEGHDGFQVEVGQITRKRLKTSLRLKDGIQRKETPTGQR